MNAQSLKTASGNALVACAAGLAAALLFVLASRGSLLTMTLGYFAPLPIMIASLSFGLWIGAAAALVGALFVGAAFHPIYGAMYAVSIAAPAAILATTALLAPPKDAAGARDRAPTFVVLVAALIAVLSVAGGVLYLTLRLGGFEALVAQALKVAAPLVKQTLGEAHAAGPVSAEDLARYLVLAAPLGLAASQLVMMVLNLWLAGRVAIISGNLPRPWPSLADDLAIPPLFGALFAAACGLLFVGGLAGAIASVFAAAFGAAYALQGLAVAHALTRGSSLRFALLFSMYAVVLLLPFWPVCLLAVLGLIDAAFQLRARKSANASPNLKP